MTEYEPYKIDGKIEKTEYIIDGLIPKGSLTVNLGYAGIGKSIFTEAEITSILHNEPFIGRKTIKNIDILLIDQDTPETSVNRQLNKMHNALGGNQVNNIYYDGMTDYSFSDNSLFNAIEDRINHNPKIGLVVLDSLNKLSGNLNVNDTTAMNKFSLFKRKIFTEFPKLSTVLNHHISEHKGLEFEDLMNENIRGLAMGNSVITQQSDSIIVLAPKLIKGGKLIELGVRPVTRRIVLCPPFIVKFIQDEKNMIFKYVGKYQPDKDISILKISIYKDILIELKKGSTNKVKLSLSVLEIYSNLKGKYGIGKLRESLNSLESLGFIKCMTIKPYPYEYVLTDKGRRLLLLKNIKKTEKTDFSLNGKKGGALLRSEKRLLRLLPVFRAYVSVTWITQFGGFSRLI